MIKRPIDFAISLVGIVSHLPLFLIICFLVKVMDRGPIFNCDERIGKNNKFIRLRRFRVKKRIKTCEQENIVTRGDGDYTKIGAILHRFGLEEMPLLFSILKGDLSFIGPKPEKPQFVRDYSDEQKKVLSVRPGLWGPYIDLDYLKEKDPNSTQSNWEEYYRSVILPKKLKADLQYTQDRFLGRDIRLLLSTIWKKLKKEIHRQLIQETKTRNVLLPLDVFLVIFSYFVSYQLRFDWGVAQTEYITFLKCLPIILSLRIICIYFFGIYKNLWKYVGLKDLISIISACTASTVLAIVLIYLLGVFEHSRSIFLIDWMLSISLIGGSRILIRMFNENIDLEIKARLNVLIIGAGDVGEMLLRMLEMNGKERYNVVGFIDHDPDKHNRTIHGVKVLGGCEDIPELVPVFHIDEVLIAVPRLSAEEIRTILGICKTAGVRHKIVPTVNDLLSGSIHLSKLRKVDISDLFGRQPVNLNLTAIRSFLGGKRVLVTGAGGSIGSELCRQIAEYHPECLILVDKGENYLHEIRCELTSQFETLPLYCSLTNITNRNKVRFLFEATQPQIVFHAAANKHVPLSEENPEEAIWNNIYGTKVMADVANALNVQSFLMISTDKAVNPTSIMGVSKRIAEIYIQSLSSQKRTNFVTVRFGNVLNSNGSVIPIFTKQIEKGGPITITDPQVERFFMSISEAVQLTLQAITMGKCGEIFILEMGKAIRIMDLAVELISQAGLKPYQDIQIKIIGLRPGEKMYEELVGKNEESVPTSHQSIKILKSNHTMRLGQITEKIEDLLSEDLLSFDFGYKMDNLHQMLRHIVPEYNPHESLNDSHNHQVSFYTKNLRPIPA